MRRRDFVRAAGGALILSGTRQAFCRTGRGEIAEPLTDGTSRGKVVGGRFIAEGWETVSEKDHILYELPEPLPEGAIEFSIRGLRLGLAGDPRKHVFGLFDRLLDQYSEDDNNAFVLRIYTGPKDDHQPGTTRFRLRGPAFGQKGNLRPVSFQADGDPIAWDKSAWYRIRMVWTRTRAEWLLDGRTIGKISYPDKNLGFRYAFLNLRNYKVFHGFPNLVFRDVRITAASTKASGMADRP